MSGRPRGLYPPAVRSPRRRSADERRPLAWRRASPFFCSDILEHSVVEHRLGQELLELGVLVLQRLQPFGVGDLQPTELRLPFVERGAADPVLATDIGRRCPRLLLTQHRDDLFFRETAWL